MKSLLLIILAISLHRCSLDSFAQNSLLSKLRDVDSAKFKDVQMYGKFICGKVNAKNAYGGYTGYQMFIGNGKVGYLENE